MNYSKQREIILKTLRENPIHPTADMLFALVRNELPNVSLATVYRNLNQLAEQGVIRKISALDDKVHFDHNLESHYHFICIKCKKVYDVPYDVAPDLAKALREHTGLEALAADVLFKGICNHCKH